MLDDDTARIVEIFLSSHLFLPRNPSESLLEGLFF